MFGFTGKDFTSRIYPDGKMSDYSDVFISIATYNERENIVELLDAIAAHVPGANVIVVDDASPDGTGELLDELARERPWLEIIHRAGKLGYAGAHVAAIRRAMERDGQRLVTMDADLSHDPAVLPAIAAALQDHDMVIGSRYIPGGGTRNWGPFRRLLSRFGSFYARTLLGLRQRDCTSGYRGYRVALITKSGILESTTRGYGYLVETLYRCVRSGARVGEVPIIFADRQKGRSKLSRAIMLEAALLPWRLRWGRPKNA